MVKALYVLMLCQPKSTSSSLNLTNYQVSITQAAVIAMVIHF